MMTDQEHRSYAKFFEALSSRTRGRILRIIALKRNVKIRELCDLLKMKHSTIYNHCEKLRLRGILTKKARYGKIYYFINQEYIDRVLAQYQRKLFDERGDDAIKLELEAD